MVKNPKKYYYYGFSPRRFNQMVRFLVVVPPTYSNLHKAIRILTLFRTFRRFPCRVLAGVLPPARQSFEK